MKDDVVSFIAKRRKLRLAEQRISLLYQRKWPLLRAMEKFRTELGHRLCDTRDVAAFPEFQAIMESPRDIEVTWDTFYTLKDKLPDLLKVFRQDQKNRLRRMIETKIEMSLPDSADLFDLAVSEAVVCRECNLALIDGLDAGTARLRTHCDQCSRPRYQARQDFALTDFNYDELLTYGLEAHPWSCDLLDIPVNLIKHIVSCYGEDLTVTTDILDASDLRFSCLSQYCHTETTHNILSWRAAVSIFRLHCNRIELVMIYLDTSLRRLSLGCSILGGY